MNQDHSFRIEHDFDFYCYLKYYLPHPYRIESLPHTAYYSEWDFSYRIFRNDVLFREVKGNYKKLRSGELIKLANDILSRTGRRK